MFPKFSNTDYYINKYKHENRFRVKEWSKYINAYLEAGIDINKIPMNYDDNGDKILIENVFTEEDYIYHTFDMDKRDPAALALPIAKYKDEILSAINRHQVVIVQSPTGSGKTTQIPQYLLDFNAENKRKCNIVVTQPRRIAAQSLAARVCKERGWTIGGLVGYKVGRIRCATEKTRLTYMTTGVLLETLTNNRCLKNRFSHIIIDEVHERDILADLLLCILVKILVDTGDTVTKIIVMSATMNTSNFESYFPIWDIPTIINKPHVLQLEQATHFNITEYYLHDLLVALPRLSSDARLLVRDLTFMDLYQNSEPKIHSQAHAFFPMLIEQLDHLESEHDNPGGVLVFLPGQYEIESLHDTCLKYEREHTNPNRSAWKILCLHSTLSNDQQELIFEPVEGGCRKIILATNIAESSITVPDIKYVVDFCLHKNMTCDTETKHSCLKLDWISKQQATQRKGRVGRVSNGVIFRLVPSKFYDRLPEETIPEMNRCALENVILHVKRYDLGSPTSILALALDPPSLSSIHDAVLTLKEVGAFAPDGEGSFQAFDGVMTSLGTLLSELPMDVRIGKLIAMGFVFGVLEEAIIIAAGLSINSPFIYPSNGKGKVDAYLSKLYLSGENCSDSFALLAVYQKWYDKATRNEFHERNSMRNWCKENSVQLKILREMTIFSEDVENRLLKKFAISIDKSRFSVKKWNEIDQLMLKLAIAAAFYPFYYLSKPHEQEEYNKRKVRELYGKDPFTTAVYSGFPNGHPAELYANHIVNHINLNCESKLERVTAESGKAFLNFNGFAGKVGNVPIEMYKAIKTRLACRPLNLNGLVPNHANGYTVNSSSIEYRLKGPQSILEMDFATMGSAGRMIQVSQESINSVAFHQNPGQNMPQLLVAGEVSVSERTTKLIASETTLLPPIPGFPELCILLFGPKAQLRKNLKTDNYISCISGLGYISQFSTSAFPNHDLEIEFHVNITKEDIDEINDLRISMCSIFKEVKLQVQTENTTKTPVVVNHNYHRILKFRGEIKKFLDKERVPLNEIRLSLSHTKFAWFPYKSSSSEPTMDAFLRKQYQLFSLHSKTTYNCTIGIKKLCCGKTNIEKFSDY